MSYCVKDVMEITGSSQGVVNSWILKGYLKAEKSNVHRSYIIEEHDLAKFLASDHYRGHPEDILYSRMFNRIPEIEECYPLNLISYVSGIKIDGDAAGPDIPVWNVSIPAFRTIVATYLTEKEQKVLEMRYRFGLTLDECAKANGLTRERIRQIQAKAERKLRHWLPKCKTVLESDYVKLVQQSTELQKKCESLREQLEMYTNEIPIAEKAKQDYRYIKLEEMDLTVRSYNCLKRAYINTIGDIIDFDKNQSESKTWYEIRNLGKRSLMEVARKTYDYSGYRIRQYNSKEKKYDGTIPLLEGEEYVIGGIDYSIEVDRL